MRPEWLKSSLKSRSGKSFLEGTLDQAQLHGILARAQNYNLEIIGSCRSSCGPAGERRTK
jgi:hypothetical protein